jgi:hypothetical protein
MQGATKINTRQADNCTAAKTCQSGRGRSLLAGVPPNNRLEPSAQQRRAAMTTTERTYRLLPTGTRALGSEKSVPTWYRAILGLLHGEMTSSEIVVASGGSKKEVLKWIDELETLGFVELVGPAAPEAPRTTTPSRALRSSGRRYGLPLRAALRGGPRGRAGCPRDSAPRDWRPSRGSHRRRCAARP